LQLSSKQLAGWGRSRLDGTKMQVSSKGCLRYILALTQPSPRSRLPQDELSNNSRRCQGAEVSSAGSEDAGGCALAQRSRLRVPRSPGFVRIKKVDGAHVPQSSVAVSLMGASSSAGEPGRGSFASVQSVEAKRPPRRPQRLTAWRGYFFAHGLQKTLVVGSKRYSGPNLAPHSAHLTNIVPPYRLCKRLINASNS